MNFPSLSLRLKIVLVIIASVIIAVLACGLIVRQSAARAEDNRARASVTEQLADATSIYSETGVFTLNATVDDSDLPQEARDAALQGQSVTIRSEVDGAEVLWAAGPIRVGSHDAVMSVRTSTAESDDLMRTIDLAILWSMLGSALVIGGIGAIVSGQLSRRLTLGAQAARKIAAGDTTVRISDLIEEGNDEVSDFARAVDTAVARLADKLNSEQRFTADLAHEMRTPLTGLVNAANLLEEDSRPAELVKERTKRLQVLVEDLLEVSRLDAGRSEAQFQPVVVGAVLTSLLNSLRTAGTISGHEIIEDFAHATFTITTDERRFERIISNLIVNSVKHGADPITISATQKSVIVSDAGPGYPPDIMATGPTRFVSSGGGGMGLGLVIAQGQAKLLGMQISFGNGEHGGARTELFFPDPAADKA